jgi:hypothetical protein
VLTTSILVTLEVHHQVQKLIADIMKDQRLDMTIGVVDGGIFMAVNVMLAQPGKKRVKHTRMVVHGILTVTFQIV